jgi:hypothetical protein
MKCKISWIDPSGKQTPDENEAVGMAHFHKPLWSVPSGSPDNKIVGYSKKIQESFPICAQHLKRMDGTYTGWTYTPFEVPALRSEIESLRGSL